MSETKHAREAVTGVCRHGGLRRACETCDCEERIEELEGVIRHDNRAINENQQYINRLLSRIEADRAIRDEVLSACKAALAHITDILGPLGEHSDNPIPTQLRAAVAKAEGRDA